MLTFDRLSIRSKLILLLLSTSACAIMVVGYQGFRAAFQELRGRPALPTWDERLTTYYREEFLTRLAPNVEGEPMLKADKPTEPASSHLQYHYIATNPQPTSKKALLDRANDYSRRINPRGEIRNASKL